MKPNAKPARLRQAALEDLRDAYAYYAQTAPHAADDLLAELEDARRHIESHPDTGSPRYGLLLDIPELRSWPLDRFPYLIFYMERPDHLDVLRLLHQSRDIAAELV